MSPSAIAATPSSSMLSRSRLYSRERKVRVTPKSAEGKKARKRGNRLFPHTHCSDVRVLLCLRASPKAAAPSSPMLLPQILHGEENRIGSIG